MSVNLSFARTLAAPQPARTDTAAVDAPGELRAPIRGEIVRIDTRPHAAVAAGDPVLLLEGMKFEAVIRTPFAGTVAEIAVSVGTFVEAGARLAIVDPHTDAPKTTPQATTRPVTTHHGPSQES